MAGNVAKNKMLRRGKNLFLCSVIVVILVIVRMIYIQFFSAEVRLNAQRLHERIFSWQEVPAHRGAILDRDGDPLAVSIYKYQVMMDYGSEGFDSEERFLKQTDSLSKLLSSYFGDRSAAQYRTLMRSGRSKAYKLEFRKDTLLPRSDWWWHRFLDKLRDDEFETVKLYDTIRDHRPVALLPRQVDFTEWQTLKKWPILNYNMGLTYNLSRTDSRIYPHGELARNTIGKLLGDRGNDYGVEAVYSDDLAAHNGKILRQRIARGFYGQVIEGDNVDPVDGSDVVTTIDVDIQDVVSRSLESELIRHNAIWGTSMVMEVATGEILAMANLGRNGRGGYAEDFNYALSTRMEPGSTFKLASVLALLEEAGMSADKTYDSGDGKLLMVGSARAQDSHAGYSYVDLRTATVQSLNGYFARAVHDHYNAEPKRFVEFLRSLHMDRTVGLEEFGALKPNFRAPGDKTWTHNNTIVYLSYGYAIELTPLHILTLYNALANDGCMVAPRLIKRVEKNGEIVRQTYCDVLNPKICSDRTLKLAQSYLEDVATDGTAARYMGSFKDFKVGAKTGTAKVAQGGIKYSDGYYMGSMVTYMPVEKPKYTILTSVYTQAGNGRTYYGAGLAGTAQREIVQYLYNSEREWYDKINSSSEKLYPSAIKGGNVKQIEEVASQLSLRSARHSGSSKWGAAAVDSLSRVEIRDVEISGSKMPNVVGMGLKDAVFTLESRGLRVAFSGKGSVRKQSIKAGAEIQAGQVVTIELK
ncbi:MAG: penicillin-binding transpeptidase domain-containing protein [Rikenellaceae bacterium]